MLLTGSPPPSPPPVTDEFSWRETVAAATLTGISKIGEAWWWTGLYAEALTDDRDLPLSERAELLAREQRAQEQQSRIESSDPAPPLGDASPLKDLPAAHMTRPLIFVPGWYTSHDTFSTLTEKLAPGNGGQTFYLKNGSFFQDKDCRQPLGEGQVPAEARVFVAVHEHHNDSPQAAAPQLQANLEAIQRVTGQPKCDALAFSQGGLTARNYLDGGGSGLGRLAMLGTPNQGSSLADVSLFLFEAQQNGFDVDWLLAEKYLQDSDLPALNWMATESQQLQQLNQSWPAQRARLEEVLIMGSDQRLTIDWGWPYLTDGDSIVEAENLGLPGVEPILLGQEPGRHNSLPFNAQVYLQMVQFFGYEGAPGSAPPEPRSQPRPESEAADRSSAPCPPR